MNISSIFIKRPVMTTLVMAAFLIFGAVAYFTLPVNDLPAVDFPTITVSASLPGADAETMAAAVATPLEKQFGNISGVESMNSTSASGSTSITLQFNLNRSIDGAAEDVQAAIVTARAFLPASMPTPPTLRKVNPSDSPILFLALSSPTLPLYTVDEYAENVIASRISMVSGVAQVQVFGSQIYAPHVQVDPRKLSALGIGIDEVATAIEQGNVNLPTGTLYGPDTAYNITANGQLFDAAAFRPLIVTYRDGNPVRLSDIGDVIDSVQTDKVASWYNNQRAVILAVQRQPGTNTIQIVDDIRKMLPNFRAICPGAVQLDVMFDRSQGIRQSVTDVKRTLLLTVILVVAVIFLFLGNLSSTIIAAVSLPISLIGTFAAMKLFGFTLNNISLMALTLCVGFVIDDAIVVLENIVRHMEMGEEAREAAVNGSREIGFTVVSMTVSLIAVFIPVLLMGGIVGRLFFEFGVTMSVAILISGFVSLSLTPMLCSRFLRPMHTGGQLTNVSEHLFRRLEGLYEWTLKPALDNKPFILLAFFIMVGFTVLLVIKVPKGFMPTQDTGQISVTTMAAQGISFEDMCLHQQELAKIISKDPNLIGFMSSVGAGGPNSSTNSGRMQIILTPPGKRKQTSDQIIQELRKKTAKIPGIKMYMQTPPSIRIGGQSTKGLYQFTLSGTDTDSLYDSSNNLLEKMKTIPGMQDVNTDLQNQSLQLNVTVDREKIALLGITMEQVQDALNSAYSQRQVSVIYTPTNQYWVILEVQPKYYKDAGMLDWLRIRAGNGDLVPLNTIAKLDRGVGPLLVNHLGQFPSVTISFNLKPGIPLSDVVSKIEDMAHDTLPPTVTYSFQGTAQAFESSISNLGALLLISVLVIYIVLGILYESFIHPLTILSGLPSAGLGALLILTIFQIPLDIYGFLGMVLLIGIVKKNAIMMIDFAVEYERSHHCPAEEAIFTACITRFRPIMMTTMAALMGSLPIALAFGGGAESRRPLGMTIVGGLLVSQLVTLYITPVFYIYLDRLQNRLQHRRKLTPVQEGI
ncbi:MAG TPA: efflux RND transporter permease subunit [Planktothrix sp.]